MSSSSMTPVLAAFITLGVVFTIGLMLLTFLKTDDPPAVALQTHALQTHALQTQPSKTQPSKTQPSKTQPVHVNFSKDLSNTSEELKADGLPSLMNNMQSGDIVMLVFYSHTCPWCKRFKSETIDVLNSEDKLPCAVKLIEANGDLKSAANSHAELTKISSEIKGLPTSIVLVKRSEGLYYSPIVGYLRKEQLDEKVKAAVLSAKKIL